MVRCMTMESNMVNKYLKILDDHGIDCWFRQGKLFAVETSVKDNVATHETVQLPVNIRKIKDWLGY